MLICVIFGALNPKQYIHCHWSGQVFEILLVQVLDFIDAQFKKSRTVGDQIFVFIEKNEVKAAWNQNCVCL